MLFSTAVQPGVWPVTFGLTSIVYVVMRRGLFLMKRAHSSATLVCRPLGEIAISVVAPAIPTAAAAVASQVVAVLVSAVFSADWPLLM